MTKYGQGHSTGLDQSAIGKIATGFTEADLRMTPADKTVLKQLAERVATIASSRQMVDARALWKRHNMLGETRPVIFCDPENGWNEVITDAEMVCTGRISRRWEMDLRKEIFWGEMMGDDKPVDRFFDVPYTVSADDWGLQAERHQVDEQGSYVWDGPIKDYATDLPQLHFPRFDVDWETTNGCLAVARELFEGILEVRLKGTWWWSLGLTLTAATFRGLSNLFYDFTDNPEWLHRLLSFISQGHLAKLALLEERGLLGANCDGTYVGSGGFGYTDELPSKGFAGKVRCIDMWGFTDSQETVNVSPEMYEEFIFQYEKPIMDRFGLTCYGCCEPLQSRWHIVKRFANLRRVSCSPWADIEKMASFLEGKYIYSMKRNPAPLSSKGWDRDRVRKELREALAMTRGCRVEVVMKDNHTIGNSPESLLDWCKIAKEEAERIS
jgi:hypothetical protein